MKLDIIGDIHGEFSALTRLLEALGYSDKSGVFQHGERVVVFVGDFIDAGYEQRAVLDLVIPMVAEGYAHAIMGNHEFNALAFHTRAAGDKNWLRPRTDKNIKQHIRFLDQYLGEPAELQRVLDFFWSLPLWLEIGGARIVHACWDQDAMDRIKSKHSGARLTPKLLGRASTDTNSEFDDIELLLKGKELSLPEGADPFLDAYGVERDAIRVKWWDEQAQTYADAYLGPENARANIPQVSTSGQHLVKLDNCESPVFFGHYWMSGEPKCLKSNVACVDFSVAREGGKLVAYRWDGESALDNNKFLGVDR